VFTVAASVPLLMRFPLRRVQRAIEPRAPLAIAPDDMTVERTISRVQRLLSIGLPLVRTGCLTRGITHYYFLRRCGLSVDLCFGMAIWEEGHTGHCWLARSGEPFLEPEDPRERFTEVCRIPHLPDGESQPRLTAIPK